MMMNVNEKNKYTWYFSLVGVSCFVGGFAIGTIIGILLKIQRLLEQILGVLY